MPTLEVDGKVICQSAAMQRYIANEHNFYGSNNLERALVDQVCETIVEIFTAIGPVIWGKDTEEKKVQYIDVYISYYCHLTVTWVLVYSFIIIHCIVYTIIEPFLLTKQILFYNFYVKSQPNQKKFVREEDCYEVLVNFKIQRSKAEN